MCEFFILSSINNGVIEHDCCRVFGRRLSFLVKKEKTKNYKVDCPRFTQQWSYVSMISGIDLDLIMDGSQNRTLTSENGHTLFLVKIKNKESWHKIQTSIAEGKT